MIRAPLIAVLTAVAVPASAAPSGSQPIPHLAFSDWAWAKVSDDFQQPASGPGPVTYPADHPYVRNDPNNRSVQPTVRIADLTNPILKPWAIAKMKVQNDLAASGKSAYEARASCHPGGVPGFLVMGRVNPMYFVQMPKEVLMINEGGPEVRHIYMNVPHSAYPRVSPYGESVGHYENGDTLVIDTIGLSDDTYIDNYRTPHTTQEHVIERFKLSPDGNRLDVAIHIEDPGAFNMPWNARQAYKRLQPEESLHGALLEAICAENNDVLFDAAVSTIPEAAKPDF
jgi:hypothetical protein